MTDSIPVPPVVPVLAYRDPVATLREKMTLWAGRKLKTEEVVYTMKTISREILEEGNLKEKCPMARTFGHLCLHHRLDRATPGGRALVDVAEATPLHDANGTRTKSPVRKKPLLELYSLSDWRPTSLLVDTFLAY